MKSQALEFHKALFEELDTSRLQKKFLSALLEMQNVERGSLWIAEDDGYRCIAAVGSQSADIAGYVIPKSAQSIVGWVIDNGRMTIAEAYKDKRHFREVEAGLDVKSTLILCYPLILRDGRVYGAVEIIDTAHGGSRLNLHKDYLELMEDLVAIGAIALGNALAFADKRDENEKLRRMIADLNVDAFIGQSDAFLAAQKSLRDYAKTDFPVLITGESGTGKELAAREIHRQSDRKNGPFLVQNVSAIPDTLLESELFGYRKGAFTGADKDKTGLFEAASGGTVFLDEIGDMALSLQARILRVIQQNEIKPLGGTGSKRVDVRIISATNKDLRQAIAAGTFREDLFYRLNVLPLSLPPLRERRDDIPLLLNYFLRRDAQRMGIAPKKCTPKALRRLTDHPWKGNIREMENLVRYLLATLPCDTIDDADLPAAILSTPAPLADLSQTPVDPGRPAAAAPAHDMCEQTWEEVERGYVLALLEKCHWNITQAAAKAGVNRSTFDSRIKKLGIRKR
ncbi:sigma-54-dependent Fis family transcriptional regulator [Desulfovibrio sulfodismutans]|uniref:Sigma-54-dependent Fis family transcriptional regulator n=2 Tax=Desulfolutivibrio sulfodismutans TaxID=63561 RepID=A0A7K3NMQ1_9BACT|nr:sigma-54-dependent Fis family transcriptional regulator [Desulfolutivibrio sulfodismutans]NDY57480.1 sigma-54-dependent Fis family transcriptional regulator [Desulfolutivibrio sulfodismutans]QLA14597.1 GAF domain-containing protein [Desulfolutivibrio sulfodismutans DSM 3696]